MASNPPRQTSLYRRIFLPFCLAVLLTSGTAGLAAMLLIGQSLENRLSEQLRHAVELIRAESFPFTPDMLRRLAALQRADLLLLDSAGAARLSTMQPPPAPVLNGFRALGDAQTVALWEVSLNEVPHLAISAPLGQDRQTRYRTLIMLASLADARSAARSIGIWLGLLALVALSLLAWWGHRISRAIGTPVAQLASMAGAIAAGDRSVRAEPSSIAEISSLTQALNGMAERLAAFEQELADSHRLAALGEMAGRVAHEIRNPMTAIRLQLQMLAERADNEATSQSVARLLREVERLDLVVGTTLTMARPMQRPIQIDPKPEDLNRVVEEVLNLVQPALRHRSMDLSWHPEPLVPLALDADRMKQVIYNLLNNAAEALNGPGTITLSSRADPASGMVELVLEDSGPGFPPEVLADFEKGIGNTTKPSGSGFGLMLSRELVERHGGEMLLDRSPALGGARVRLALPAR